MIMRTTPCISQHEGTTSRGWAGHGNNEKKQDAITASRHQIRGDASSRDKDAAIDKDTNRSTPLIKPQQAKQLWQVQTSKKSFFAYALTLT